MKFENSIVTLYYIVLLYVTDKLNINSTSKNSFSIFNSCFVNSSTHLFFCSSIPAYVVHTVRFD